MSSANLTATENGPSQPAPPPAVDRTSLPSDWKKLIAPFRGSKLSSSLFQLITTGGLFVLCWLLMLKSLEVSYWLTLPIGVVGTGALMRIFIFFHDCTHGSFFNSAAANRWLGRVLGVLTLTPFALWRKTHNIHHATSGNLDRRGHGDVDTWTVKEYLSRTPFQRYLYRFGRHPLAFMSFGAVYLFLLKHRLPLGMSKTWRKEWASVLWNNLALVGVVLFMSWAVGLREFLSVQIPLTMLSTTLGIWLFYVQHQYEKTYWRREEEWNFADASMEGSSHFDLPQPLRWMTGNIGIHHIHHLCSAIPNYRLKPCMDAVQDLLPPPRRLTLRNSLPCGTLALWDEESRKLVGFKNLG